MLPVPRLLGTSSCLCSKNGMGAVSRLSPGAHGYLFMFSAPGTVGGREEYPCSVAISAFWKLFKNLLCHFIRKKSVRNVPR